MRISIVVPIYNEERHIEGCIQALLAQDYPSDAFEIIMVDNNSTDRSAEIVRRYPNVRLLHEPVQGDFASRNCGIAASTGEVIAFTDSDTAPFSDWLQSIANTMSDPKVGVIVGKLEFAPDSRLLAMMADYEAEKADYIFSSDIKEIYFGYTCNMAVRKSVFDELGPFEAVQRNADVVLVRRTVDHYSCDAAVYGADVRVRRLEIPTIWSYLHKQTVYGRDFPRYATLSDARTLDSRERLEVFRNAARKRGYSMLQSALLLSLLVVGALCYDLAKWLSMMNSRGSAAALCLLLVGS